MNPFGGLKASAKSSNGAQDYSGGTVPESNGIPF